MPHLGLERAGQVDPTRGRPGPRAGARLTSQDLSQNLHTLITGLHRHPVSRRIETSQSWRAPSRPNASSLPGCQNREIATRNGECGATVADRHGSNYGCEEPILWRRNRAPSVTVRGDIVDGVQAPTSSNASRAPAAALRATLAAGLSHRMGGVHRGERQGERRDGGGHAPSCSIAILRLLMIQLQSFPRLAWCSSPLRWE